MDFKAGMAVLLAIFLHLAAVTLTEADGSAADFSRKSFPPEFLFGAGSAAYQYEGAWDIDGKGPSIWDTFTHKKPQDILDHSTGDVALDFYHRYKEDVGSVKKMNMNAFRFSISWSRILPNGTLGGGINWRGVQFYDDLINEVVSQGLTPFVTIFHFDTPQALESEYLSFLSKRIVADYVDYADLLFKLFGDRVKHWVTFNEPYTFCGFSYGQGILAPGRCSKYVGNCTAGNSGTEPYIACHNLLLAHAAAVRRYRDIYQEKQKGQIGITLVTSWYLPNSNSTADASATRRSIDFNIGWFMEPLYSGSYPKTMRALIGNRLPKFTKNEADAVKGSYDFIGLNYYSTYYILNSITSNPVEPNYATDSDTEQTGFHDGVPIGPQAASSWLFFYAPGLRDVALYFKVKYNDPLMFITENGADDKNNETGPLFQSLNDNLRLAFHFEHLKYLSSAIDKGARVQGYFAWSLNDDFEWNSGYTIRFGLHYVDYNDNLKRIPKKSALWFREFLAQ